MASSIWTSIPRTKLATISDFLIILCFFLFPPTYHCRNRPSLFCVFASTLATAVVIVPKRPSFLYIQSPSKDLSPTWFVSSTPGVTSLLPGCPSPSIIVSFLASVYFAPPLFPPSSILSPTAFQPLDESFAFSSRPTMHAPINGLFRMTFLLPLLCGILHARVLFKHNPLPSFSSPKSSAR